MTTRTLTVTLICSALLTWPGTAAAQEEFTVYEMLEPGSGRFAITYDATAASGASVFLNPVRRGAAISDERVVDLRTGAELPFTRVIGAEAKAEGLLDAGAEDDIRYLRIQLPSPVPAGAEARLRIFKTYVDAASYFVDGNTVVFERALGVRANAVVLPAGYELIGSATPGMVSTLPDGRIKVSFVNDRDDMLPVRVVGRRIGGGR